MNIHLWYGNWPVDVLDGALRRRAPTEPGMATERRDRAIVAFLASDEAAFITGAILAVDGGALEKGR